MLVWEGIGMGSRITAWAHARVTVRASSVATPTMTAWQYRCLQPIDAFRRRLFVPAGSGVSFLSSMSIRDGAVRRNTEPLRRSHIPVTPDYTQRWSTTMRFMMLMIPKGYETAAPGAMPPADGVAAMMQYNKELQDSGALLSADGLHPPSMGALVAFAGGKATATDGPAAAAKEVLGGYWIINVNSKDEAVNWAKRIPAGDNEIVEVRQIQEFEDFPADVQAAITG